MLKGIDPRLGADLLHVLRAMGHGDTVIMCDTNFPAAAIASQTVAGHLITMENLRLAEAAEAVLSVLPLDTFVDDDNFRTSGFFEQETLFTIVLSQALFFFT